MHMVFIGANFNKMYFVPFADFNTCGLNRVGHFLSDRGTAIFDWTDEVIQ